MSKSLIRSDSSPEIPSPKVCHKKDRVDSDERTPHRSSCDSTHWHLDPTTEYTDIFDSAKVARKVLLNDHSNEPRDILETPRPCNERPITLINNGFQKEAETLNNTINEYNKELINPTRLNNIIEILNFLASFWSAFRDSSKGNWFKQLSEQESKFLVQYGLAEDELKKGIILKQATEKLPLIANIDSKYLEVKSALQEKYLNNIQIAARNCYWEDHLNPGSWVPTVSWSSDKSWIPKVSWVPANITKGVYNLTKEAINSRVPEDRNQVIYCCFEEVCMEALTPIMPKIFFRYYIKGSIPVPLDIFGNHSIVFDDNKFEHWALEYIGAIKLTPSAYRENQLLPKELSASSRNTKLQQSLDIGDTIRKKLGLLNYTMREPDITKLVQTSLIIDKYGDLEKSETKINELKKILDLNKPLAEYIAYKFPAFRSFWESVKIESTAKVVAEALASKGLFAEKNFDSYPNPDDTLPASSPIKTPSLPNADHKDTALSCPSSSSSSSAEQPSEPSSSPSTYLGDGDYSSSSSSADLQPSGDVLDNSSS